MAQRIKNLRHPIHTEINGQPCVLLTVGYLADAIGRSTWTVKYWTEVIGLLPPPVRIEHPETPNLRRGLYTATFVSAMKKYASKDYVVDRLDRKDWPRFHAEVLRAYELTVAPLLQPCLTRDERFTDGDE